MPSPSLIQALLQDANPTPSKQAARPLQEEIQLCVAMKSMENSFTMSILSRPFIPRGMDHPTSDGSRLGRKCLRAGLFSSAEGGAGISLRVYSASRTLCGPSTRRTDVGFGESQLYQQALWSPRAVQLLT